MKRFICFIFLIGVVTGIVILTMYTLDHKELRDETEEKIVNKIEQVTSNLAGNNLSEIYNVYLNKEKHKIKLSYTVTLKAKGLADINLVVYFDGALVYEEIVADSIRGVEVDAILARDDVSRYVKLDLEDIKIIAANKKDYMVLTIGYLNEFIKEKYYVFNNKGEMLDKKGIIVSDTSKYYVDSEGLELDIFYDNINGQKLAKIENNKIYALEEKENKEDKKDKEEKKSLKLVEYEYIIKDGKLEREKLQEYENITIKDVSEESEEEE